MRQTWNLFRSCRPAMTWLPAVWRAGWILPASITVAKLSTTNSITPLTRITRVCSVTGRTPSTTYSSSTTRARIVGDHTTINDKKLAENKSIRFYFRSMRLHCWTLIIKPSTRRFNFKVFNILRISHIN